MCCWTLSGIQTTTNQTRHSFHVLLDTLCNTNYHQSNQALIPCVAGHSLQYKLPPIKPDTHSMCWLTLSAIQTTTNLTRHSFQWMGDTLWHTNYHQSNHMLTLIQDGHHSSHTLYHNPRKSYNISKIAKISRMYQIHRIHQQYRDPEYICQFLWSRRQRTTVVPVPVPMGPDFALSHPFFAMKFVPSYL